MKVSRAREARRKVSLLSEAGVALGDSNIYFIGPTPFRLPALCERRQIGEGAD